MSRRWVVGVWVAVSLFGYAEASAAGAGWVTSTARKNLFVGFNSRPGPAEQAMLRSQGAIIRGEFPEVNAIAITLDGARMDELARQGGVAYVEEDPVREKLSLSNSQLTPSTNNGLYGLVTTRAVTSQGNGWTGTGVKICVADTSIDYRHPDIAANYVAGTDTVGAGDNDPINDDGETHGTHVAGTILGVFNTVGVYGVAYNAKLYYARVLGPNGGTTSDIMEGVRWLKDQGCHIVNLSLGGGLKSRTEENFYKQMRTAGLLVVAAAGNGGSRSLSYPAGYAVNISVGAVDRNNSHADFSNAGKGLDVVAPGVAVLSSVPAGTGSEASVTNSGSTSTALGMEYAPHTTSNGVSGTLVDCGTGQTGEFPSTVSNNIALIQRGTITFADKVTNAMNAGAKAVIIYNNVAGDFSGTLGSAGTWIPTVSVSDVVGAQLKSAVGTSATVVDVVSDWDLYSGTSMATPHASGVLGLILQARGLTGRTKADADAAENYLKSSARDLGAAGYDTTYGYGIVQAP